MAKADRAKIEENAHRVIRALDQSADEFEKSGVSEASLVAASGVAADEMDFALDYLENREAIVRDPVKLASPPEFVIKPGRSWPEFRKASLASEGAQKSA